MAKLKAVYSIPELAEMAGIHRHKVRRILESSGAKLERQGRVFVVYLNQIKRAFPDLWESILDRQAAR